MAKSVDPDQTAPIGAVCSGSTLFASILNSSVMLGNYFQQTTFSDEFFSWCFKGSPWKQRLSVNNIKNVTVNAASLHNVTIYCFTCGLMQLAATG